MAKCGLTEIGVVHNILADNIVKIVGGDRTF